MTPTGRLSTGDRKHGLRLQSRGGILRHERELAELGTTGGVVFFVVTPSRMGFNDRAIAKPSVTMDWHRVRRGAYVDRRALGPLSTRGPAPRSRPSSAAYGRSPSVVLSHISRRSSTGAEVWDIDLCRGPRHAGSTASAAARRRACEQHRGILLGGRDRGQRNGVRGVTRALARRSHARSQDVEPRSSSPTACSTSARRHPMDSSRPTAIRCDIVAETRWPPDLVVALADPQDRVAWGDSNGSTVIWSQRLPTPEPQYKVHDELGSGDRARGLCVARVRCVRSSSTAALKYVQSRARARRWIEFLLREKRRARR